MLISFIVLNWHNDVETIECVESLRLLEGNFQKQIIVVDNESTAETFEGLAGLKDCVIVRNEKNLGFAGGVNSGLPYVKGVNVALINNDCVVHAKWLKNAQAILDSSPKIAAVGGKEYFWNANNKIWDVQNEYLSAPLVNAEHGFPLSTARNLDTVYVASLMGSNVLMRTKVLKKLNGFDNDFFAYCEETDLCVRAIASGHKIVYSPKLMIWHKRNLTSNRVPFLKYYLSSRNKMIFIAKNFPTAQWKRMVFDAAFNSFIMGITGSKKGLTGMFRDRKNRLDWTERRSNVTAALWAISHITYLNKKRAANINQGSFTEDLPELLHALQDSPERLLIKL